MKHEDAPDTSTDAIVVECDLDEPPEKVWRALTAPELVADWLLSPDEPAANDIEHEVLEAQPNHLLRYSWRGREDDRDASGHALDTIVTFELTETHTGGTHLRVVHSGFDAGVAEPGPQLETLCCAPLRLAA
jgi:uncharacterized protein YndB with AHSA1/START domain